MWLSPNLGRTWEDSPQGLTSFFLAFVAILYVNRGMQIWCLTTISVTVLPGVTLSLWPLSTCVHVSMCVRETGGAREKQGERGFVIELRVIEFSGRHNPNHLTFKRPLSSYGLQLGRWISSKSQWAECQTDRNP